MTRDPKMALKPKNHPQISSDRYVRKDMNKIVNRIHKEVLPDLNKSIKEILALVGENLKIKEALIEESFRMPYYRNDELVQVLTDNWGNLINQFLCLRRNRVY